MQVDIKLSGLEGVLATLKQLPPEIVSKRGGPVKSALRKGAKLIRDEARVRFQSAVDEPGRSGITDSTGFTKDRIIYKSKNLARFMMGKGERFIVTVKPDKHPRGGLFSRKSRSKGKRTSRAKPGKQAVKANDIAFFMEWGTRKQPATPWLRPAFNAKAQQAIEVVQNALLKSIDKIVRELAQKNKGK